MKFLFIGLLLMSGCAGMTKCEDYCLDRGYKGCKEVKNACFCKKN